MKRIIALILVLNLMLCGCGSAPTETVPSETIAATELVDPIETLPQVPVLEAIATDSGNVVIQETVVFDNGDFKLTAKEIDFSDEYDVKVKFLAENNSNANVSFVGSYFSINGITMYCNFYIEVAAGKKANNFLKIDKNDLSSYGISNIAIIKAQDTYIYNKDISKTITNFRFEINTSIAKDYQQEIDRNGQIVYDQNGILVKYRGIVTDYYGDEELEFYVENTSNANIEIFVDNVSVNGFMVYGNMVAYAYPGCVTYSTMSLSSSDLEENDIEAIEEVSLNLYGRDQDIKKRVWESEEFTVDRNNVITAPVSETSPTAVSTNSFSMADVVAVLESSLKENYDSVSVTYEGTTIDINLSYPGLASAAQNTKSSNDKKQLEAWDSFVASLKKTNTAALAVAQDAGFSDATVIMNFRNDLNLDNILIMIMNDTVIYDTVNS